MHILKDLSYHQEEFKHMGLTELGLTGNYANDTQEEGDPLEFVIRYDINIFTMDDYEKLNDRIIEILKMEEMNIIWHFIQTYSEEKIKEEYNDVLYVW